MLGNWSELGGLPAFAAHLFGLPAHTHPRGGGGPSGAVSGPAIFFFFLSSLSAEPSPFVKSGGGGVIQM